MLRPLPELIEAFRTGEGVPYADYGADTREGIADLNRAMFINELGSAWLPAIADVHARLTRRPAPASPTSAAAPAGRASRSRAPTRTRSSTASTPTPPRSRRRARTPRAEGLDDRVRFDVEDASDPALDGVYDLVTIFEALHDMARPVEALRTRAGCSPRAARVIVADERVAERFAAPGTTSSG